MATTPGVSSLPIDEDANEFLKFEIEYRLRYVIQEAWKIARRSHRTILQASDVQLAHNILVGKPILHNLSSPTIVSSIVQTTSPLTTNFASLIDSTTSSFKDSSQSLVDNTHQVEAILQSIEEILVKDSTSLNKSSLVISQLTRIADFNILSAIFPRIVQILQDRMDSCLNRNDLDAYINALLLLSALTDPIFIGKLPILESISRLLIIATTSLLFHVEKDSTGKDDVDKQVRLRSIASTLLQNVLAAGAEHKETILKQLQTLVDQIFLGTSASSNSICSPSSSAYGAILIASKNPSINLSRPVGDSSKSIQEEIRDSWAKLVDDNTTPADQRAWIKYCFLILDSTGGPADVNPPRQVRAEVVAPKTEEVEEQSVRPNPTKKSRR
jgi:TATA box binding protein associated factor (TAF)